MQAQPRACRQAVPGELARRSLRLAPFRPPPPGFPCEKSAAPGWFPTERPSAGCEGRGSSVFAQTRSSPRLLPDWVWENPSISTWPRVRVTRKGSRGLQPLPGDGLGGLRCLVPAVPRKTSGSLGNLVSGWGAVKGLWGGSGPAEAGLHRLLLANKGRKKTDIVKPLLFGLHCQTRENKLSSLQEPEWSHKQERLWILEKRAGLSCLAKAGSRDSTIQL
ncbi:uncharacterized protein LOC116559549 [Sapajus apella]|uniref:Uncharacterized protein LOC116559549 n=1 Tax=Sapajus apella TaxID=9515 RepID=A0A6J3IWD7_SAPAP|nr:uncharacterized protein LOC116559549 [Sapajus apella]